jgi:membrane protease YdiL (CAAX protease family)
MQQAESSAREGDSMEPETQSPAAGTPEATLTPEPSPGSQFFLALRRVFIGSEGLRAGWSALLFVVFTVIFLIAMGMALKAIMGQRQHGAPTVFSPVDALISEVLAVLAILGAGWLMALIEQRRIMDYNLTGPNRLSHFLGGVVAGFVALSALVGALAWGGWLHFGPVALSGAPILAYGAVWALAFLLTGFFEEGSVRCYLQFTLTRGINFWWALAAVAAMCLDLVLRAKGNGVWGVFAAALLGLIPCLVLHLKKVPRNAFWQAAWVTSTFFGFLHTTNNGEDPIGIFSAAAIGFVFCVSIWVTGSVWWAIGCHAAWDWAESFFYGTADSGMVAKGHLLTTSPAGNIFWSGGTDGPEGSVLVLAAILLLLLLVLLVYGRKRPATLAAADAMQH